MDNQQPLNDLDTQGQQALNPDQGQLSENDPNVARDPVCGNLVDKRTAQNTFAPPVNVQMETLYFDSPACKALFEDNPAQYGYPNL